MKWRPIHWVPAIAVDAALFAGAALAHLTWLWIAAIGLLSVMAILALRRLANRILDEGGEGEAGRMLILPRPSGLGSQAGTTSAGSSSNFLLVEQPKQENGESGGTEVYGPETAWTSRGKKTLHE